MLVSLCYTEGISTNPIISNRFFACCVVDLHISLSLTIMKVTHVKALVADCDKGDLTPITLQIRMLQDTDICSEIF